MANGIVQSERYTSPRVCLEDREWATIYIEGGGDRWIQGEILVFQSHVTLHEARKWILDHFISPTGRTWNHARIRRASEYWDVQRIVAMELPLEKESNSMYWCFHPSGVLIVKSTFVMLARIDKQGY